jgi:hypothetical protein
VGAPTILDYYTYAALATASYVRMGSQSLDGANFAREAADPEQAGGRLPLVLGTALFNPANANAPHWRILHYHGGDVPGVVENTGLAATLFERGGEKVLAIRGTEFGSDPVRDFIQAGLGEIGLLGIAISQTVALFNLVQRLTAPQTRSDVLQLTLRTSLDQPPVTDFVRVAVDPTLPLFRYYWLEARNDGQGTDAIQSGESIVVVGHSLGGHLAAMAARLFSDLVSQGVAFNSARYDPPTSAKVTGEFLNLFRQFGASPASQFNNVLMLDSEDLAPGDDTSIVSSFISGTRNWGQAWLIA